MSGHSKWSQIKRQKGAADVARGATFTKLSNAITIAVRQGGGISDPSQNFRLRLAIEAAKRTNMPKDTITRAISRAMGKDASQIDEVTYEGFAPGGVAVIVEAATDNANRTSSEIKGIFNKAGASFGQPGTVSYLFKLSGEIIVKKNGKTLDDIFQIAAEAQADDVEDLGLEVSILTSPEKLSAVRDSISSKGLEIVSADLIRIPMNKVSLESSESDRVINFLNSLESLDDVQRVYSNAVFRG